MEKFKEGEYYINMTLYNDGYEFPIFKVTKINRTLDSYLIDYFRMSLDFKKETQYVSTLIHREIDISNRVKHISKEAIQIIKANDEYLKQLTSPLREDKPDKA